MELKEWLDKMEKKTLWIIGIIALLVFMNSNNTTKQTITQFVDNCASSGGHNSGNGDAGSINDPIQCFCQPMENVVVAYDETKIFMGC